MTVTIWISLCSTYNVMEHKSTKCNSRAEFIFFQFPLNVLVVFVFVLAYILYVSRLSTHYITTLPTSKVHLITGYQVTTHKWKCSCGLVHVSLLFNEVELANQLQHYALMGTSVALANSDIYAILTYSICHFGVFQLGRTMSLVLLLWKCLSAIRSIFLL